MSSLLSQNITVADQFTQFQTHVIITIVVILLHSVHFDSVLLLDSDALNCEQTMGARAWKAIHKQQIWGGEACLHCYQAFFTIQSAGEFPHQPFCLPLQPFGNC